MLSCLKSWSLVPKGSNIKRLFGFLLPVLRLNFNLSMHSFYSANIYVVTCWIKEFLGVHCMLAIVNVMADRSKISLWRGSQNDEMSPGVIWDHRWGPPHPDLVQREERVGKSLTAEALRLKKGGVCQVENCGWGTWERRDKTFSRKGKKKRSTVFYSENFRLVVTDEESDHVTQWQEVGVERNSGLRLREPCAPCM